MMKNMTKIWIVAVLSVLTIGFFMEYSFQKEKAAFFQQLFERRTYRENCFQAAQRQVGENHAEWDLEKKRAYAILGESYKECMANEPEYPALEANHSSLPFKKWLGKIFNKKTNTSSLPPEKREAMAIAYLMDSIQDIYMSKGDFSNLSAETLNIFSEAGDVYKTEKGYYLNNWGGVVTIGPSLGGAQHAVIESQAIPQNSCLEILNLMNIPAFDQVLVNSTKIDKDNIGTACTNKNNNMTWVGGRGAQNDKLSVPFYSNNIPTILSCRGKIFMDELGYYQCEK